MYYDSMDKRLVALFTDVAKYNPDPNHRTFYLDSLRGIAYAGYRRSWGLGDLFARYQGDIEWNKIEGLFILEENKFIKDEQLCGPRTDEGVHVKLRRDDANAKFEHHYARLEQAFVLKVNPTEVLQFINDATYTDSIYERIINIHPFYQMNSNGHFVAQLEPNREAPGEWLATINTAQGSASALVQSNNEKIFNFSRAKSGDWVVFEPIGIVNGHRVCRAIRPYKPGIRMAIQRYNAGCKMPGDAPFSIIPREQNNGMTNEHIKDFDFIKGQDLPSMNFAPMLTVQLDSFIRVMNALSTFKLVEIRYLDSHSPFIAYGCDENQQYQIDVICSSFSPFKLGKIITE